MTTKEIILQELSNPQNSGKFTSGEKLAEVCHVSRAAVWKAIKILQKSGYCIEAITNCGYKLLDSDDVFSKENIEMYFPEGFLPNISFFKTIDSTNTEAKRRCVESNALRNADGELTDAGKKLHQSVIISETQTAGRGRLGRAFYSPKKTGIYLSIIIAPKNGITEPAVITASAAVAVCRAIQKLYHAEPKVKWVNDIFINGKKICGILTEGINNFETGIITAAVIGIGINISDGDFPDDIAPVVGSITGKTKSKITRSQLAAQVILEALQIYNSNHSEQVMAEYKALSMLIGKTITITPVIGQEKTAYTAKVTDIDSKARLIVETPDGNETALQSGEVSLHSEQFL